MNCKVLMWLLVVKIVVFPDRLYNEALDTIAMEDDDLIYPAHDVWILRMTKMDRFDEYSKMEENEIDENRMDIWVKLATKRFMDEFNW